MDIDETNELVNRISDLEKQLKDLRYQSQKQIDGSISKYRRILNSTSEGYLELDLNLTIVDFNTTILSLLGKDEDMLLNHSIETLYEKNKVFVHFGSRKHLSFEATFYTGNGKKLPLLLKRSIMHDHKGKPCGYLVFLTDLTELEKAKEDLQQAEARYRAMYKNATQGMYQCTLNGRFLRVNPAMAKMMFGYNADKTEIINYDFRHSVKNIHPNLVTLLPIGGDIIVGKYHFGIIIFYRVPYMK